MPLWTDQLKCLRMRPGSYTLNKFPKKFWSKGFQQWLLEKHKVKRDNKLEHVVVGSRRAEASEKRTRPQKSALPVRELGFYHTDRQGSLQSLSMAVTQSNASPFNLQLTDLCHPLHQGLSWPHPQSESSRASCSSVHPSNPPQTSLLNGHCFFSRVIHCSNPLSASKLLHRAWQAVSYKSFIKQTTVFVATMSPNGDFSQT